MGNLWFFSPPFQLGSLVADCKQPPELDHGFVTFSTPDNLTTYQSGIQYSCQHPFYQMVPNVTGIYSCDAKGVWNSAELGTGLPSCQPDSYLRPACDFARHGAGVFVEIPQLSLVSGLDKQTVWSWASRLGGLFNCAGAGRWF
ncbi:UNVERIFIED_CONTAM: hypothetical protein K2H54_064581 [Gekko kuhli]